ncbi:MAG: phosphatidate cytidylyltransferase [Treponema sp.]|jgi:phosphatidate cytidylyltransferase|nr:phosphatidate cytidylyltransferase [Treponema sp.]
MKKLIPRLLIFFVGLPVLFAVVILLPAHNHLVLNLMVVIASILGAMEFQYILKLKNLYIPLPEAAILGGLIPGLTMAVACLNFNLIGITVIIMAGFFWLIVSRVFSSHEKQDAFVFRVAAGFSVIIYPGLFLTWIILMTLLPNPEIIIITFLLIVFLNDSVAWATGMLFGNGNRGIIPASPNKSIAGFIGGILASVGVGIAAEILFPQSFDSRFLLSPLAGACLGFISGIAAILGDLGESVLKRSAVIKDSGFIMPGRGGILDSIDSIALAAPVFFLVYSLLFIN